MHTPGSPRLDALSEELKKRRAHSALAAPAARKWERCSDG